MQSVKIVNIYKRYVHVRCRLIHLEDFRRKLTQEIIFYGTDRIKTIEHIVIKLVIEMIKTFVQHNYVYYPFSIMLFIHFAGILTS